MQQSIKFECLQCGTCCRNLLRTMGVWTVGLTLIPDEIGRFPSDLVFPYIGIGRMGRPKRIVVYQLNANTCPHLEGNKCGIYLNRPLSCQSYPFEIEEIDPLWFTIDESCRWLNESIKMGKATWAQKKKRVVFKERILAPKELEASYKLYKRGAKFFNSKDLWIFDLKRKMWGKGVSEEELRRMRRR